MLYESLLYFSLDGRLIGLLERVARLLHLAYAILDHLLETFSQGCLHADLFLFQAGAHAAIVRRQRAFTSLGGATLLALLDVDFFGTSLEFLYFIHCQISLQLDADGVLAELQEHLLVVRRDLLMLVARPHLALEVSRRSIQIFHRPVFACEVKLVLDAGKVGLRRAVLAVSIQASSTQGRQPFFAFHQKTIAVLTHLYDGIDRYASLEWMEDFAPLHLARNLADLTL